MSHHDQADTITINTVPMVADYVLPLLIGIVQSYPQVILRYVPTMQRFDIDQGSLTLHIRGGPKPVVTGADVRFIGNLRFCLFGSSAYLAQHGLPRDVADLARYGFIIQDRHAMMTPWERWLHQTLPEARITLRSDCDISHRLAVSLGHGLGFLPMSALLFFTDLVEVMPALDAWTAPMWLVVDHGSLAHPMIADTTDKLHQRLAELWP